MSGGSLLRHIVPTERLAESQEGVQGEEEALTHPARPGSGPISKLQLGDCGDEEEETGFPVEQIPIRGRLTNGKQIHCTIFKNGL